MKIGKTSKENEKKAESKSGKLLKFLVSDSEEEAADPSDVYARMFKSFH